MPNAHKLINERVRAREAEQASNAPQEPVPAPQSKATRVHADGERVAVNRKSVLTIRYPDPAEQEDSVELTGVFLNAEVHKQLVARASQSGLSLSQLLSTFVNAQINNAINVG